LISNTNLARGLTPWQQGHITDSVFWWYVGWNSRYSTI